MKNKGDYSKRELVNQFSDSIKQNKESVKRTTNALRKLKKDGNTPVSVHTLSSFKELKTGVKTLLLYKQLDLDVLPEDYVL